MSLYAQYVEERGLDQILETESGFATFRYVDNGKTLYIVDIFVHVDERRAGVAAELADTLVLEAKRLGCTNLIGTVVPGAKGAGDSIKVLLAYGMEPFKVADGLFVFRKEL